jgi:hypothetical protein
MSNEITCPLNFSSVVPMVLGLLAARLRLGGLCKLDEIFETVFGN